MMGMKTPPRGPRTYVVDLDQRVRADHPLRTIADQIDFTFVREEVAHRYGKKGQVSVDPVVILKLLFLLFYDNVPSEQELLARLPERLDYLWFLGYGLDEKVPDSSVLSKARRRWGPPVFERFCVRLVGQCVAAGLVGGDLIHVDSSLVDANAARSSVVKSSPELIAALKQAYQAQEAKLEATSTPEAYQAVNDRMLSPTDPDAPVTKKGGDLSRPRYHHHRVVDDAYGVITAVVTTPGSIAENKKLLDLLWQHQTNTHLRPSTVVTDHKYGTAENYVACQQRGWQTHLGDVLDKQKNPRQQTGIFPESRFTYQPESNTYRCPAGQQLHPRHLHGQKRTWEYHVPRQGCARCPLHSQCTTAKSGGRTLHRHEHQDLLEVARAQAHSPAAKRHRRRRQELMERSFADAANNHGFKRARWRRLWRQQIQDYLIATVQNIRVFIQPRPPTAQRGVQAISVPEFGSVEGDLLAIAA